MGILGSEVIQVDMSYDVITRGIQLPSLTGLEESSLRSNSLATQLFYAHTHTSLPHTHPSPSPDLQFFLIGIHTQPSNVLAELNALVEVYEEAVNHFGIENGIMLGDFNADCSYLSQKRYNTLLLVTDSRFTWLLDTSIDSTTGNSDCAYDRCACVCVCVCVCVCWWRGEGEGGGKLKDLFGFLTVTVYDPCLPSPGRLQDCCRWCCR